MSRDVGAAAQGRRIGPAVLGLPLGTATRHGDAVVAATLDVHPARAVVYHPASRRVTGAVEVPGRRVWAATSAGGRVLLGLWNVPGDQPNLVAVDLARGSVTPVARVPAEVEFWALDRLDDTQAVAGTDRGGQVAVVDLRDGTVTAVAFPGDPGDDVVAVAAGAGGIHAGTRGSVGHLWRLAEGSAEDVLPATAVGATSVPAIATDDATVAAGTAAPAPDDGQVVVALGPGAPQAAALPDDPVVDAVALTADAVWATGKTTGSLARLDRVSGQLTVVGRPLPGAPTRRLLPVDGRLVAVTGADRVIHIDPETRATEVVDLLAAGADGEPLAVMSLAVVGARPMVVAAANNRLQSRPLDGGAPARTVVPGEAKAQLPDGGGVLLALYPYAQLRSHVPGRDQAPLVADWDPTFNRPRDLVRRADGTVVVGVRSDARNQGALVGIDPGSGAARVLLAAGLGRSAESVVETADGRLLVGTDDQPPQLVVVAGVTVQGRLALPGARRVTGLATSGTTAWTLAADGTAAVVDLTRLRVTAHRRVVAQPAGELTLARGRLLAVSRDALVALDRRDLTPRTLVGGLAGRLYERPRVALSRDGRAVVVAGGDLLVVSL